MYIKVLKMMAFGTLVLQVHVWMISAKGMKHNDKQVSVHSLPLHNLEQNRSLQWVTLLDEHFWYYHHGGMQKHPGGGADGKNN